MLCTLFHSLLSSPRKSSQPLHLLKSLLWWWYRMLTPLLLFSGAACYGEKVHWRVRSLGFLITVLPLPCWGMTEKLLGLFGLSFLLCKVRGVGTWSRLYQTSPSWEQVQWAPIHAPDSVPGAEEAARNTRKSWRFLKRLKMELPYHPAISLLSISEGNEVTLLKRYLYPRVQHNIIHNGQDMETT